MYLPRKRTREQRGGGRGEKAPEAPAVGAAQAPRGRVASRTLLTAPPGRTPPNPRKLLGAPTIEGRTVSVSSPIFQKETIKCINTSVLQTEHVV